MARITIYGADWCGDCIRTKYFLDQHNIEYEYIDIGESAELAEKVVNYNIQAGFGPKRRIPIILVNDMVLSEPSNDELGAALGIRN